MDFSNLSKEHKQYIALGAIGVIVVGYGLFAGVGFALNKISDAKVELEDLNMKISRAGRELSKQDKTIDEFEHTITVLESHLNNLPPEANYYSWATEIVYSKGRKAGLEVESVDEVGMTTPSEEDLEDPVYFETYSLRITAHGSYASVILFLKDIEDNHPLVRFSGLEIAKSNDPEKHSVQLFVQWPFKLNRIAQLWKDQKREALAAEKPASIAKAEKPALAAAAVPEKAVEPAPKAVAKPEPVKSEPVVAKSEPVKRPTPPAEPAPTSKPKPTRVVVKIPESKPEPKIEPEPAEPAVQVTKAAEPEPKPEPKPKPKPVEPVQVVKSVESKKVEPIKPAPEPVKPAPVTAAAEPKPVEKPVSKPEPVPEPEPVVAKAAEPETMKKPDPVAAVAKPEPVKEPEQVIAAAPEPAKTLAPDAAAAPAAPAPAKDPEPVKTDDHFSDILASINQMSKSAEEKKAEEHNAQQEEMSALLALLDSRGTEPEEPAPAAAEEPEAAQNDLEAYMQQLASQPAAEPVERPSAETVEAPMISAAADDAPKYVSSSKSANILEELLMKNQPEAGQSLGSFLDGIVGDIHEKR